MSVGRAWVHGMEGKLDEIARAGFEGIEVFYEDLEYEARAMPGGLTDDNLVLAAGRVRGWCDGRGLAVICLQPFMHYEGLTDRAEHEARIARVKVWFAMAKVLGTAIIQLPSNFQAEGTTGDMAVIVADIRELADLAAQESPVVSFAYESLCWGRHHDLWEQSWAVVRAVDRPNVGLCLDTFNIAGRCWADPGRPDGRVPDADAHLAASLARLRATVDVAKILFIQVVDAERLDRPLDAAHPYHVDGQPARMSWSRNCRLFPFEHPGYLPILDILRTITQDLGYRGFLSFELFSRTMADPDPAVPRDHARRGMAAWHRLVQEMAWEDCVRPSTPPDLVDAAVDLGAKL
ncbi:protein of unknown function [Taphrina deformans PYCC 5710]|uniref:Xylose isomerase-like TIM barrel domain-containing protein n=1 Tax=Taphrina deformans (strain PYCC 5710 / ATCC 11124 / CBS 356.35 / IMI 108563 / JCM 9778 / NBRC 8474) TaxID=1097556 RepID=R4XHA0_TAPDE|nr:protein of unknown function [Taphrina deformans PYCC 5710]|eukprot:CCG85068.1 protein of unknown function [Taphrina deformans PYCC 5710]